MAETLTIPDDWIPTPDAVNALPLPLRRYIMQLETHSDPSSTLQELWATKAQVRAVEAMVARWRDECGSTD